MQVFIDKRKIKHFLTENILNIALDSVRLQVMNMIHHININEVKHNEIKHKEIKHKEVTKFSWLS